MFDLGAKVAHLKSIVDWSGLCEKEKSLETALPFWKYKYFVSHRFSSYDFTTKHGWAQSFGKINAGERMGTVKQLKKEKAA